MGIRRGGGSGESLRLSSRNRGTLESIRTVPTRADVRWARIETLVTALGGDVSEGRGSRVRFALNGLRATFHRPHPEPETNKSTLEAVRDFLQRADVG